MGLFSSKTKYYVDSSTFPMFDPKERVDNFQAAMLDYTSNSPIEMSEYMNQYYGGSKLRNFRGYLRWCDSQGFTKTFGKIKAYFYGDAEFDNSTITDILKKVFTLKENEELQVYQTTLNFFSEDFFIKYLATQQGKEEWVYQESDIDYTIEYPTDDTIKAVFEDGRVIEGTLPSFAANTQFLEIRYSIITTIEKEIVVPPVVDEAGNVIEEGYTYIDTKFKYRYGFYQYQYKTGVPDLDFYIENNGIEGTQTFYPVIPIRTNTAWFTGTKATMINETLKYLDIYDPSKGKEDAYGQLKKMLTDGMDKGSLKDIDYITLLLGVSVNTTHQSDLRYLYEFFYNLYLNTRLTDPDNRQPSDLTAGSNFLGKFFGRFHSKASANNYIGSNFYKRFNLRSPATNFNYTYYWGDSEYFEANGKFKPNAKVGDYGVLATNTLSHTYSYLVHSQDSEGNYLYEYIYDDEDLVEVRPIYETRYKTVYYDLTCFCKQESENRFRFTMFVDLGLQNLIYHGKSIITESAAAIRDASIVKKVTHDFGYDFPSAPGPYHKFTFNYVDFEGDPTNAFIVPIEQNTFYEVGVKNQLEITYGSHFLVCNCWVKKKVKWYQSGIFKIFVGIVLIVIAVVTWGAAAAASAAAWAAYGYVAAVVIGVTGALMVLEGLGVNVRKIYTAIFGDSVGNILYQWSGVVAKGIIAIAAAVSGQWYLYAALGLITMQEAIDAGSSLGKAFLKGVVAAGTVYLGAQLAPYLEGFEIVKQYGNILHTLGVGETAASAVATSSNIFAQSLISTGESFLTDGSFSDAFTTGLITFGAQSGSAVIKSVAQEYFKDPDATLKEVSHNYYEEENIIPNDYSAMNMKDVILDSLIGIAKNPNTYANLASLTMEERHIHKLRNLENDYQEFNQKYQSALDALNQLRATQTSTVTAEFVAIMQANLGRFYTLFPDMLGSATPEQFLTLSVSSGSDQLKASLGTINNFVDSKLSVDGYTPYPLYYTQMDPCLTLI